MRSSSMIESRTSREPPDLASTRSTLSVLIQCRDWCNPCDPCRPRQCLEQPAEPLGERPLIEGHAEGFGHLLQCALETLFLACLGGDQVMASLDEEHQILDAG